MPERAELLKNISQIVEFYDSKIWRLVELPFGRYFGIGAEKGVKKHPKNGLFRGFLTLTWNFSKTGPRKFFILF